MNIPDDIFVVIHLFVYIFSSGICPAFRNISSGMKGPASAYFEIKAVSAALNAAKNAGSYSQITGQFTVNFFCLI